MKTMNEIDVIHACMAVYVENNLIVAIHLEDIISEDRCMN